MERISVMLWTRLSLFLGTVESVFIRRRVFNLKDKKMSMISELRVINSGSRAEGLSLPDSDFDTMYLLDEISVSENSDDFNSDIIIDTNDIKPGFVKLRCLDNQRNYGIFTNAMIQSPEGLFMSSLLFRDLTVYVVLKYKPGANAHGPCATVQSEFKTEYDFLICLPCRSWLRIASEWTDRVRRNNWPSPDLIQNILQEGCLLVPIGNPNSQERDIQWRISFSLAEKKLVHSFNQTQLLCYGLLKLFLKHVINSNVEIKGLLCSYFLKTNLFYCIEEENIVWDKENFIDCFWTCFRRLLKWARDEYCPNYFIKNNNMFEGKVCGSKGRILFDHLFKVYNDGLDSLLLIPCFSGLSSFVRTRNIPSNITYIRNEISEYLCDIDTLNTVCDCYDIDFYCSIKLNAMISSMMQQSLELTDSALLTLTMSYNTMYNIVPSLYRYTKRATSHKSRYRQNKGLKQFIINNCRVSDVSTVKLLLATLCYLSGQYKEVVTIVQKVLKQFKSVTLYLGMGTQFSTNHPYIDLICGKGLSLIQKLRLGVIARPFICFVKYKFYPHEIETELLQQSCFNIAYIPPVVYCNVLLFLSYYHMGCRDRMSYTLNELYIAVQGNRFIGDLERPLANALLQRCLQIFEN